MATNPRLTDLATWVEQSARAGDDVTRDTLAAIVPLYAAASATSSTQTGQAAGAAAAQSQAAQAVITTMAAQYLANVLAVETGILIPIPDLPLIPIRNGVPLEDVFQRPFKAYRLAIHHGASKEQAAQALFARLATTVSANLRLAEREAWRTMFATVGPQYGITGYRRIVHPELSRTGSCGLCIAASDVEYDIAVLLPIHARCKCSVMPIVGELDPGNSLNNLALGDLYSAAGDTTAAKLKRTRFEVNEHGEWGPVLTDPSHRFKGPDELSPAA